MAGLGGDLNRSTQWAETGLSLRPKTKMIHLNKAESRGCDATFFGCRRGEGLVRADAHQ